MKWFCFLFLISFLSIECYCQTDNAGSGHAIQFDGINDYIDYGSVYHNLNLPFTISAWVFLDPNNGAAPIFTTNDNDTVYRGFWLTISPTALSCEFGDGTGGNNPAYRRGKLATIQNVTGRWVHACVVMRAPFDIDLYINGINVGGATTGGSNLSMASSFPGDIAKTAYFEANGGVTYYYKGQIDEIRLWNRALSQDEVRQGMCKRLIGNESGLIGYWNFDETTGDIVFDKSVSKHNGTIKGGRRVFSGAPIGDDSKYQYSSNWAGTTFSFQDNDDVASVKNIQGNPEGVHIYEVKNVPSQTGGLTATEISKPYFGIFAASLHLNNSFDVTYSYKGATSCNIFTRTDNSIATWNNSSNPLASASQRTELIKTGGVQINFDLGSDKVICNQPSVTLSTGISDPQFSILWSTGQTTSSINVTQSGKYVAKVSSLCGSVKDSVSILFASSPPSISLGSDTLICNGSSVILSTGITDPQFSILWNTGQLTSSINVTQSGKYVAKVSNLCGVTKDSVSILIEQTPTSISLGDDQTLCVFEPITLNPIANSSGFEFTWQDNSSGASFLVKDFGKYWVTVKNDCGISADTISFSKYEQQLDSIPNVITPNNGDALNQYFKIDKALKGKVSLMVLNRWGKEVYWSSSYENDWDGGGLSPGVYYFVLTDPCHKEIRDSLTIIH